MFRMLNEETEILLVGCSQKDRSSVNFNHSKKGFKKFQLLVVLLTVPSVIFYFAYTDKLNIKFDVGTMILPLVETRKDLIKSRLTTNDNVKCHYPKLNPFDKDVMKSIKKPTDYNCTKAFPLIFTTDLESNLILTRNVTEFGYTNCCYKYITRKPGDGISSVVYSDNCFPIVKNETKIPAEHEMIAIYCENNTNTKNVTKMVDAFAFAHLKPEVEARIARETKQRENFERENLNIVMLGLDAISHMNFIRTMPKSYEFLAKELFALGFDGYTKTGGNTFPNVVSILMGLSNSESKMCWQKGTIFDTCPFIWKAFSNKGYRTVFVEDVASLSIFNFYKNGFKKKPTDYYLRPFSLVQDNIKNNILLCTPLCYGPRISFDILMDYSKKLAVSMGKDKRYFQFLWSTALSHDYINMPTLGDETLLSTLEWFQDKDRLNNTVLILLSDHGVMFGDWRNTYQGRIEERMPFLYFVFPKWFSERYGSAVSNMVRNRNKLTSPYDLHETLKDFLSMNISDEEIKDRTQSLLAYKTNKIIPRGISLFLPIPSDRDCAQAGIDKSFCVCHGLKPVSITNNTIVVTIAKIIVAFINELFIPFPQCASLKLLKILSAEVAEPDLEYLKQKFSNSKSPATYGVSLVTVPGNATFEATVFRNNNDSWSVSNEVSRTNLYGNSSHCVSDFNLKKYCYCL